MKLSKEQYQEYIKEFSPNSPLWKDVLQAFWIGGLICVIGQAIMNGWLWYGLDQEQAGTATSITMIGFGALLTGFSVYDDLAKHAGAGTLVPITGFSNAVVSPAIEFKTEGFVLGVGAKMFTIAGPVIVYGVSASVVHGLLIWSMTLL